MKKFLIALTVMLSIFSAHADDSKGPIGYPGSNWSMLTLNPSVLKGTPEDGNVLLQGRIEQGIDWFRFGQESNWRFNTYVAMGYSADKNGLAYNNKYAPTLGAKVSRDYPNGVLDLGVQIVYENHFAGVTDGPRDGVGVQAYASYWFGWNLKK